MSRNQRTYLQVGNPFFEAPILNSPYERPSWHWELDDQGQPTQRKINTRRDTHYVSPIPRPRKQTVANLPQNRLTFGEGDGFSTTTQAFDPTPSFAKSATKFKPGALSQIP